jgi:hypothetical protein
MTRTKSKGNNKSRNQFVRYAGQVHLTNSLNSLSVKKKVSATQDQKFFFTTGACPFLLDHVDDASKAEG